jgi:hypothetical protein
MKRLLLCLLPTAAAQAHHGQDFFVTLDTRVPEFAHGSVFTAASWAENSGADETVLDAGFLAGLGAGFAAGATVQSSNETPGSFGYAGITPLLQWTAPLGDGALRFGASASYHFADSSHTVSHFAFHRHVAPDPGGGPGGNPDAPPAGSGGTHIHGGGHSHSHDGIHRHGEDHFQARLIGEWQAGADTRVLLNLIAVGTGDDDIDFGYALALRREITATLAAGLECTGDLDSHGRHEAIAGLFYLPRHDLTLRLGAGGGFGPGAASLLLHGGLTWRF